MRSDINDLCDAFLAALTNAGYALKSIETRCGGHAFMPEQLHYKW